MDSKYGAPVDIPEFHSEVISVEMYLNALANTDYEKYKRTIYRFGEYYKKLNEGRSK